MLKKLLRIIAIILVIIAIIYFIVALLMYYQYIQTVNAFLTLGIQGFSWVWAAVIAVAALALAYVIDPEVVTSAIGKVTDGLKFVATALGTGLGAIVGGGIKGLLSNPTVLLVGAAFLGYTLLSGGNDDRQVSQRS